MKSTLYEQGAHRILLEGIQALEQLFALAESGYEVGGVKLTRQEGMASRTCSVHVTMRIPSGPPLKEVATTWNADIEEMRSLIDGVYEIVELYGATNDGYAKEWAKNWCERARKYGAGGE